MESICKFSTTASATVPEIVDIESTHPVYKVSQRVFQIGNLDYDNNFILEFSKILDLGLKFIPSYFYSISSYYNFLLNNIDSSLNNFNKYLFFEKNKVEKGLNTNINIQNNIENSTNVDALKLAFDNLKSFNRSKINYSIPLQLETIDLRNTIINDLKNEKFELK